MLTLIWDSDNFIRSRHGCRWPWNGLSTGVAKFMHRCECPLPPVKLHCGFLSWRGDWNRLWNNPCVCFLLSFPHPLSFAPAFKSKWYSSCYRGSSLFRITQEQRVVPSPPHAFSPNCQLKPGVQNAVPADA